MQTKAVITLVISAVIALTSASTFSFSRSLSHSSAQATAQVKIILPGHGNEVRSVVFSPDSKILASGSVDGTVKLWDAHTGDPLRTIPDHTGNYNSIAFSPDGKQLAVSSPRFGVKLYEANSGKFLRMLTGSQLLGTTVFSADGTLLATASENNIRLWNPQTGVIVRVLTGHDKEVTALAMSSDGKSIVSADGNKSVIFWDGQTGKPVRTVTFEFGVGSMVFSPNSQIVAIGSQLLINLFDARTGAVKLKVEAGENTFSDGPSLFSLSFSPDGESLAVAAYDFSLVVLDTRTGKRKFKFEIGAHPASAAISPDGKRIACGTDRKAIMAWSLETDALQYKIGTEVDVQAVAYSPDEKVIANDCGFFFHAVNLRDAQTGKLIRTLSGHSSGLGELIFSPDGKMLCGTESIGPVYLWNVETGELAHTFAEEANSATFSLDSKTLVTNGRYSNGTLKLWDVETGKLKRSIIAGRIVREKNSFTNKIEANRLGVVSSRFSADGTTIVALVDDGLALKIWNTKTGALLRQVALPSERAGFGVLSPDAKLLLDEVVAVRTVATGKVIGTLVAENLLRVFVFAPDAKLIIGATADGPAVVWEVQSGKPLRKLTGHSNRVNSIAFAPDGNTVLTGSEDGTVKMWDVQSGEVKLTVIITEEEATGK